MAIATALLTAVGFFGYTTFGADVKSTVTLNLPPFVEEQQLLRAE